METLILIIISVAVLILAHEWGHFYIARKLKVKVEEFGFGFPPRLFSMTKNGIRYSFNLLPLGGFVRIFGEQGEDAQEHESFASRPAWQRFVILAAGVGMNLVAAWILFTFGAGLGVPQVADEDQSGIPVSIIAIMPGSPAENAGLKLGDKILELRAPDFSLRVEIERDIKDFAEAYRGEEVTMVVKRGSEIIEAKAIPRVNVPDGEGPLGIALGKLITQRSPWYRAPFDGAVTLFRTTILTITGFGSIIKDLIFTGGSSAAVSGPVGIFTFAQDSKALGVSFFLQFIGILSVNLAILNFLPIPALDGGRVLFLIIEKIKGKKVDPNLENMIHSIGFVLLILLMVFVTYQDVAKIW